MLVDRSLSLAASTFVALATACGSSGSADPVAFGGGPSAGGAGGSGASPGQGGTAATAGAAGSGGTSGGGTGGAAVGGAAGMSVGGGAGSAGAGGVASQVPPYDERASDRDGCVFAPGMLTTETVGPNVPHGDALPFEHVVVLMMENRSFDHYFSKLPDVGITDVDVASDSDFNFDPLQIPPEQVTRFHETRQCIVDVAHHWTEVHLQFNLGMMDGFVATNNPGGARAMGYYDQNDLPYYYWLAQNFSLSDRHFSSLLGPTWPNRFYFYGATSWGNTKTGDISVLIDDRYQTANKITDQLDAAGRSWKIYRDGLVSFGIIFDPLNPRYIGTSMAEFDADVDNDTLPNLSIIDPTFLGSQQNDEHPPANTQLGPEFVGRVLNKILSNPVVWQKTVFVLFYDEHGGFYDHTPPPPACEPDNFVPQDFRFDRLGIRTPIIVASPWNKRGYVSHIVTDLTSVTRFIQNRFDLPAMTARDANAWPMLDMFDFTNPPNLAAPAGAPSHLAPQAGKDFCANNPPGTGRP